jgi:hypothetical protein
MENLMKIGEQTGRRNLRVFLWNWHRKTFETTKILNINEKLFASRTNLKNRIKVMSCWNEEFNRSQLSILNDYEKGKMLNSLRLRLGRKEVYIAFNKWRFINKKTSIKEDAFFRISRIWHRYEKKVYFRFWKNEKDNFNRFIQHHTIQE